MTTDYKLIAKTMANRLKLVLDDLIHEDQNGFMKGRNIGCNIRTIIDLIEYTDIKDIPGSIVLLNIAQFHPFCSFLQLKFWPLQFAVMII